MQRDDDFVAEARQRFIHRVIHDLVNQMVQSALVRRADIHARSLAHGLKPFEHLNLVLVICAIRPFKLIELLRCLTEDQKRLLLAQIETLLSQRG